MEAVSLSELNRYIQRVFSLNFTEPIWVKAEIAQIGFSRGHYYLELVEKGIDDSVKAKIGAALWKTQYAKLLRKHQDLMNELMTEGIEVLIAVNVQFHEIYGLKLVIEDIDPAYTFGQMALQRQAILNKLDQEGLLELNGQWALPPVLQRIAVISSPTAAGYQDFVNQLDRNEYGYAFNMHLFPAAMQGEKVEKEIVQQLQKIEQISVDFDCIVIIRGGGSKLDLAHFDNYKIGKQIAFSSLPVLTGLGHERDESVADIVANTALKTPTAVAEFILQKSLLFESEMLMNWQSVKTATSSLISVHKLNLSQVLSAIKHQAKMKIQEEKHKLVVFDNKWPFQLKTLIQAEKAVLKEYENLISYLDPRTIMSRGYSITTSVNGQAILSLENVQKGQEVITHLRDGRFISKVQELKK